MTTSSITETAPAARRSNITTSPDGKWRTFHNHAGLMQYVPSGMFFGRFKIDGKIVRASLDTTDKASALLELPKLRGRLSKPVNQARTFADGLALFNHETDTSHHFAPKTVEYRHQCIQMVLRLWPGVVAKTADQITLQECQVFAMTLAREYSATRFNNIVFYLRRILKLAGLKNDDNPMVQIKNLGIPPKQLQLPSAAEFDQLLKTIEQSRRGCSQLRRNEIGDYVRFLTYSGARWWEASQSVWSDVDFDRNELTLNCAKRRAVSSERRIRILPMIPALRDLLIRLKAQNNPKLTDLICPVKKCYKSLTRACVRAGLKHMTHHSFRHLFATFCIEAGIDIPTVSRWLGHMDGGALAMKVYGHLRREHSQAMAQKVVFGIPALPLAPQPKQLEALTV